MAWGRKFYSPGKYYPSKYIGFVGGKTLQSGFRVGRYHIRRRVVRGAVKSTGYKRTFGQRRYLRFRRRVTSGRYVRKTAYRPSWKRVSPLRRKHRFRSSRYAKKSGKTKVCIRGWITRC